MPFHLSIVRATGALLLLTLCACNIRVPDGKLFCASERDCPSGWSCIDQRCFSARSDAAPPSEGHVGDGSDAGADAQPAAADAGGMRQDGDESDSGTQLPAELPRLDATCDSVPGVIVRACGASGIDKLVCLEGKWKFNGTCDGKMRCSTRPGAALGTCQPVAALCDGKEAGDAVCDHGQRKRCSADLTDYDPAACPQHKHCEGDDARCVCDSGYRSAAADSCEKDTCPSGYERSADGCKDIDECAMNHGGCDVHRSCVNSPGSFSCGDCAPGFAPSGATQCVELDPCEANNGGCSQHRVCVRTADGPSCGACDVGYVASGATDCADLDECATNNGGCGAHRQCVNTQGSFSCGACAAGYADSDGSCVDVDECAMNNGACAAHHVCSNTDGGHTCGGCQSGYVDNGSGTCADVDECATNNGGCDSLRACMNTDGSFSCGSCPAGYSDGANGSCVDINECELNPCPARTTCLNTPGGHICEPIDTCLTAKSDSAIPIPPRCLQN